MTFGKMMLAAAVFMVSVIGIQRTIAANTTQPAQADAVAFVVPDAPATVGTSTPDALLTTAALTRATADGAASLVAATATQAVIDADRARTATVAVWTQRAVDDAATLRAAENEEAALRIELLAGTLTALPPALTETQAAHWATVAAEQTQAGVVATVAAREAQQADAVDAALYWATLALIGVGTVIVLAGLGWVVVALSWRAQGEEGGKAQAAVVTAQVTTRAPIPTTTAGAPATPLDPHTRIEHVTIRVLQRMAQIVGADSVWLASAPDFGDNRSRDRVVTALTTAGLAESVNGVGVKLLGWTLGELTEAIADGSERLPDPPAPAGAA